MTSRPGAHILAPAGPRLTADEAAFFREAAPFGFILFARNVETPDQVRALTAALRDSVGRDAPVLIDQEGGRVQRLRAPHWREWEPPLNQVEADGRPRAMYLRGLLIGAELAALGIDANCAPSADIAFSETHPFLQNRCYGRDAATVTAMAREMANGLLDAGVLPVVKHAPGHGRATLDSHFGLPTVEAPLEDLTATDFAPFRALTDLPMAMTAHLVVTALDPDRPVTLSPVAMAHLRREIGLDMLMMTDDISMGALSGSMAERSRRAIAAGCDLVLHCNGDMTEMEAVAAHAGRLSDDGQRRADAALAMRRTPLNIDIPAAEAELGPLIRETAYA
ncbi:beta-hexosaminidase [Alphaproteobacteria bacterium GH1-50]|uniref:beta-N-acetylhexosaminidase n=1 Tax=Kangsaoukella pontilimi TaxID=2691042 RepID=A0A7C9ND08_9RHOB|nr:glycoside hydrolase family 3 N-terminal domain-containing protein [Kangsaoukella pontilimi]MXQ07079.1 beta-hexosaminidase [Kangsaoukella pontilimi]